MVNCIFLFRKDLRLMDNTALIEASNYCDKIYPAVFLENFTGEWRWQYFYLSALNNLNKKIHLHIIKNNLFDFIKDTKSEFLFFNKLYDYESINMENKICENIKCKKYKDYVLVDKSELKLYKVFTPYYRKWLEFDKKFNRIFPDGNFIGSQKRYEFLENFNAADANEEYAIESVESFDSMNYGPKNTSRLSKFINNGLVSIRFVYDNIKNEDFRRQLCWRDFYYQLYSNSEFLNGLKSYSIEWKYSEFLLNAWKEGKTGYPIIDAGMRQLDKIGWIDNRIRLLVSYFLTKILQLNWKKGEEYFREKLEDYDPILNIGNWQWISGIGADTRPLRKFNILRQSKLYDPDGSYIRKWVDELKNVPEYYVHEPWKMKMDEREKFSVDYPFPIVDINLAFNEFKNNFYKNLY